MPTAQYLPGDRKLESSTTPSFQLNKTGIGRDTRCTYRLEENLEKEKGYIKMNPLRGCMGTKIMTRSFVLSSFAQFTFSLVLFILIPTIPIYLSRLGANEADIGILVGASSAASLLLRPLIGKALLRIPERRFMAGGAVLYTLSSVGYLVASPFWPLLIVRLCQGIGWAFFVTAAFTLVSRISPQARRGQSLGYFFLAINLAFALGPMLGIFLVNRFTFRFLFYVCIGLSLCSLGITFKLGSEKPLESSPSPQDSSYLSREALPPSVVSFIANVIWGALTAFLPLYALACGVDNPGLFFTVLASTLMAGRLFGGRILDVSNRERVMLPCLVTQTAAMVTLVFSKSFGMFLLVAVIWGLGSAFLFPLLMAQALEGAGSLKGPAIGTFTGLSDLGTGLGAIIMGFVLQKTDYPTMFSCLVLTAVLNLLYFHFFVRSRRRNVYADLRISL